MKEQRRVEFRRRVIRAIRSKLVRRCCKLRMRQNSRMHILIMGLNHQIQGTTIGSWGSDGKPQSFEKDQKDRFRQFVQSLIAKHGIQFICEETRHGQTSLVEALCAGGEPQYNNIEMPPEERERRKISRGYNEDPAVSEAEKERGNREREDYMAEQALNGTKGCDRILVVCGRMHSEPLASRFRSAGHSVEVDDLRNQGWYVEDWQHHILHNL